MTDDFTYMTLDDAEGAIAAGDTQQEQLDSVTRRIASGEFHKPVSGTIPAVCIDGRPGGIMGPNSAGGTFTLTVADDLTTKRFSADKSLAEADRDVARAVIESGAIVGGHCDEHAAGDNCGCGAKDKIGRIYDYMARHQQDIRNQATALGVVVTDEIHDRIIANAAARTDFSTGAELSGVLKDVAGADAESTLRGSHNEVVAAINVRQGTSLDREALAEAFGDSYQAFNADVWSFETAAKTISLADEDVAQKVIAMVYYNLATAGVLCGQKMRVVVVG